MDNRIGRGRSASRHGRYLGITVGAGIMAIALAGCVPASPGGSGVDGGAIPEDSDSKDFTIYWNAGHAYEAYQAVIDDFAEEHDLNINWQKFQWPDMTTKLAADFRGNNAPDLVEGMTGATAVQYGVSGDVLDLSSFIDDDAEFGYPADFTEAAVSSVEYDGATYGTPFHQTANGLLYYNRDLLGAAGYDAPPTTWDEAREIAKATTAGDTYGLVLNSNPLYAEPWLYQGGVTQTDAANGEFMTPEDKAADTMQFLQDLVFTDHVSPVPSATTDYAVPQQLFAAGRAAMFVSGPWELLPLEAAAADIDWGVAPPLKGEQQASSIAGTALMIPSSSPHPHLAWELLTELTSLETELAATEEAGMSMPRKSWAEADEVAGDEHLSAIAEAIAVTAEPDVELAASGVNSEVADLWKAAYQAIVIQQRPVDEVLNEFREQAGVALG